MVLSRALYVRLSGCDDERCLQCRQPDQCSLCEAPFFLSGARCVRGCGKRHYADEARRECRGKLGAACCAVIFLCKAGVEGRRLGAALNPVWRRCGQLDNEITACICISTCLIQGG